MTAVVQRVLSSSLIADGVQFSECKKGFLVLVGVREGDTREDADYVCDKIAKLRVFEDENGKMNLSLVQLKEKGEDVSVMAVSQFTLCADCSHGNRPDFFAAMKPEGAKPLYEYFVERMRSVHVINTVTGVFGADMLITLQNDGPVTIIINSEDNKKKSKN